MLSSSSLSRYAFVARIDDGQSLFIGRLFRDRVLDLQGSARDGCDRSASNRVVATKLMSIRGPRW
jgi:sulfate adenylyltransferase subunit 1 (EFTu-like GTPase family)